MTSEPINAVNVRSALLADLDALVNLEQASFISDKLSQRSFRRHIQSIHSDLLVAIESNGALLGYGLVLKRKGTRLARLYSLAVAKIARGKGIAQLLLDKLECCAAQNERHYMRLEVAKNNSSAIALYAKCGYRIFGEYIDYYEDHTDALRMHKRIRTLRDNGVHKHTPWLAQSTDFSCGPASLMMAMASINQHLPCSLTMELDIWREATTIFMTSGHGGCHPFGLAMAAQRRGFKSEIWINSSQALFIDGVRSAHKKHIMSVVHEQFLVQCHQNQVVLNYQAMTLTDIEQALKADKAIIMLISTYRLDEKKAPHWLVVTGVDENCLFVHDPDLDEASQTPMDCQYIPIAKEDFEKMAVFGSQRIRAAVVISAVSC